MSHVCQYLYYFEPQACYLLNYFVLLSILIKINLLLLNIIIIGNVHSPNNSPLNNQPHNPQDVNQHNFSSSRQPENHQQSRKKTKKLLNNSAHKLLGILRQEVKAKTQSNAHQSTDIILDRENNEIDPPTPKPGLIQSDIFKVI